MATRNEKVRLTLDDAGFSSGMARAAMQTALLNAQLNNLNNNPMFGSNGASNFNRNTNQIGNSANNAGNQIDKLSGRLGLFADAALMLGPGLVPIGAVGAQALGGLAAAATAVAVAGGSAVVAFQGLGDAVKSVQEYQLDPTVAGLEKAQEAMAKLGPDAQRFVMEFQNFRPVLSDIKRAAEAGWFPGLTESLEDFERLAPKIEGIFFTAGQAGGFLVDGAAESLSSERWAPFLAFLEDEVPTAMGSLVQIMGSLSHGAAEMFMAMDPGNDRFLAWMEDVASGFDRWASSSQGQESIQGFLEYARENGPAVADLFSSLVGALSAIAQAAAPLGGPVLKGLTAAANAIEAIASSDMATPILAAIIALRTYNRLIALSAKLTATTAATNAASGAGAAAGTTKLASLAKGAGIVAILAAGAKTIEMAASANNDFVDSIDAIQAAITALDFGAMHTGLETARTEFDALSERFTMAEDFGGKLKQAFDPGYLKNQIEGMFGKSDLEEAAEAYNEAAAAIKNAEKATGFLGRALGQTVGPIDGSARSIAQLEVAAAVAKPSMDALGITTDDLNKAFADQKAIKDTSDNLLPSLANAVRGTLTPYADMKREIATQAVLMDSAAGKTKALGDAMKDLSVAGLPAAEKARSLSDALDALLDPANNAEAATDAWRLSLQGLRKDLDATAGFKGYSEAALANREMTRSYVDGVQQRLVAMVAAGAGEKRVAQAVRDARSELVQSGIAAGFSAREIRKRADQMGLTPKLVKTVFEATGLVESTLRAQEAAALYKSLPRRVQTKVATDGVPKTLAELNKLDAKMNLTAKERRSIIKLMDLASGPAGKLGKKLDDTAKPRTAKVSITTTGEDALRAAKALMDSVNSKTVTLTVQRTASRIAEGSYASGGFTGSGGKHEPAGIVHRGEVVIPQDLVRRDWSALRSRYGHLPGFATGGVVGNSLNGVNPGAVGGLNGPPPIQTLMSWNGLIEQTQRALIKELKTREKLVAKEVERDKAAVEREKSRLDLLKQERKQLADAVAARFTSSPFSATQPESFLPGITSQMSDAEIKAMQEAAPDSTEAGAAAEAVERFQLMAKLRARGLPPALLAQIGSLPIGELRGLANYDDGSLARWSEKFYANQAGASPVGQLKQQIADAKEFLRLMKMLEKQGLSGAALADAAQNASLQQLQTLASGGASGVQQYNSLFNQRDAIAAKAGGFVGDALFGEQIKAQTQVLLESKAELMESNAIARRIEQRINAVERAVRNQKAQDDKKKPEKSEAADSSRRRLR